MKALIISDEESPVPKITTALHAHGYETIRYKWLIKALDNVGEIEPDLTVVNIRDYPRHWKIFAQFAKNSGTASNIILYAPDPLSDSEQSKAKAIGIRGWFSFDGQEGAAEFDGLLDSIRSEAASASGSVPEAAAVSEEGVPIPSVDGFLSDEAEHRVLSEPHETASAAEAERAIEDSTEGALLSETAAKEDAPAAMAGAEEADQPSDPRGFENVKRSDAKAESAEPEDNDDDVPIPSVDMFANPDGEKETEPEPEQEPEDDFYEDESAPLEPEDIVAIPSVDVFAVADAFIPSVDVIAVSDAPILSVDDCCKHGEAEQSKIKPGKSLLRKIEQIYEKE